MKEDNDQDPNSKASLVPKLEETLPDMTQRNQLSAGSKELDQTLNIKSAESLLKNPGAQNNQVGRVTDQNHDYGTDENLAQFSNMGDQVRFSLQMIHPGGPIAGQPHFDKFMGDLGQKFNSQIIVCHSKSNDSNLVYP